MSKLLLIASMAAMIILPIRAARFSNARVGLKRTVVTAFTFNIVWTMVVVGLFLFLLQFDVSRLYPPNVKGP